MALCLKCNKFIDHASSIVCSECSLKNDRIFMPTAQAKPVDISVENLLVRYAELYDIAFKDDKFAMKMKDNMLRCAELMLNKATSPSLPDVVLKPLPDDLGRKLFDYIDRRVEYYYEKYDRDILKNGIESILKEYGLPDVREAVRKDVGKTGIGWEKNI